MAYSLDGVSSEVRCRGRRGPKWCALAENEARGRANRSENANKVVMLAGPYRGASGEALRNAARSRSRRVCVCVCLCVCEAIDLASQGLPSGGEREDVGVLFVSTNHAVD
jgi:hypothetical protein